MSIPVELRERPQWVLWRREERDGKLTKVPYTVGDPNRRASATDPTTWSPYAKALAARDRADGIGYVFADDDPFCGVDLDACFADDDELHPAAAEIVAALDSYTERSPSGRGIHVLVRADLDGSRHRTGKTRWAGEFEVYSSGRYFTVTGEIFGDCWARIEPRQEGLDRVLSKMFPPPTSNGDRPAPTAPALGDDRELLERARAAKNGPAFSALWNGEWQGAYGSPSEADLALVNMLAFWTGPDPERLDRLFRSSGLHREKWDTPRGDSTYGRQTIERALEGRTDFYEPPRREPAREAPPNGDTAEQGGLGDERRVTATRAASIRPEPVRWAWAGRMPLGGVTLLAGRQGLGKSQLLSLLAAQLSRGQLDGDLAGTPGDVLLVTYEDHAASTVVPRLMAAGADLDRVHVLTVEEGGHADLVSLPGDVERIAETAREHSARCLMIDPLMAALPGKIDSHRDQDVRRAISPLAQLAEDTDLAVLAAIHLRKGSASEALDRVSGSVAFTAAARSVLAFGQAPEDEDGPSRVLAHAKSNLSPLALSLAYAVSPTTVHDDAGEAIPTSQLRCEGECDTRAGELLSPSAPADRSEVEAASEWLADLLAGGEWHLTDDVRRAAKAENIAWRTVGRARENLEVETDRFAPDGSSRAVGHWRIPVVPTPLGTTAKSEGGTTADPAPRAESRATEPLSCQDAVLGTAGPDRPPCSCATPPEGRGPDGAPGERCKRCQGTVSDTQAEAAVSNPQAEMERARARLGRDRNPEPARRCACGDDTHPDRDQDGDLSCARCGLLLPGEGGPV